VTDIELQVCKVGDVWSEMLTDGCAQSCNNIWTDTTSAERWQSGWNGEGHVKPVPNCRSRCTSRELFLEFFHMTRQLAYRTSSYLLLFRCSLQPNFIAISRLRADKWRFSWTCYMLCNSIISYRIM